MPPKSEWTGTPRPPGGGQFSVLARHNLVSRPQHSTPIRQDFLRTCRLGGYPVGPSGAPFGGDQPGLLPLACQSRDRFVTFRLRRHSTSIVQIVAYVPLCMTRARTHNASGQRSLRCSREPKGFSTGILNGRCLSSFPLAATSRTMRPMHRLRLSFMSVMGLQHYVHQCFLRVHVASSPLRGSDRQVPRTGMAE